MERTMPFGPYTEAFFVSSVMWAEASYPVTVYRAINKPIKPT
ncbi:hypothetical protein SNOUR_28855 [Streptomyces noursei ATCC 11455]|nr:hypothetical protein SNOUR_28855 [Streptomyces noursei ATCC 11455]